MRRCNRPAREADVVSAGADELEFLIDGESLSDSLIGLFRFNEGRELWAPWRRSNAALPHDAMDDYVADASASLQGIIGRRFKAAPVGVPIMVTATDSDGNRADLMHSMIVELPKDRIVSVFESRSQPDGNKPVAALRARFTRSEQNHLPTPVLWSPKTTAIDVSNRIRESSARAVSTEPVEKVAERILDEETKYLARLAKSESEESVRFQNVAGGLEQFTKAHGCLPPAALLSTDGKPLLSWRVLLLPYVEHGKYGVLFNMFHLDEPWDSEHNRRLIPFVSLHLKSSHVSLREGHTHCTPFQHPRALPQSRTSAHKKETQRSSIAWSSSLCRAAAWFNTVSDAVTSCGTLR